MKRYVRITFGSPLLSAANGVTLTMSTETVQELSLEHNATSTDAFKYPAAPETTSQFMARTTNTTESTSITKEAKQTATATDAATMMTSSKTVPQSSSTSSSSVGFAKNTTTSADASRISTGFEATPKSSSAHSPTFTSESIGTSTSAHVEENRPAIAITSPFPSYVISSSMSTSGTNAEMPISSTITTPRLHSHGDVSEKKSTNTTKAKVACTSETAMPARIVEPTPRYHGHKHCNRNVFMLLNLNDILHGSGPNQTVHVGGTIQVGCPSSGGDGNITLTCEKTGSFVPSPSTLSCTSGVKTPFNTKELKSCEQCDAFGTETCEKTKSGVACQCRENWSGQTCWKAADQCDITHLQCGKHGVCRSEVDYASCACDYGFTGEHCNVSKTNTTIISSHKSFGDLASAAGVLVLTWYDIVIMVIKAALLIHSPSVGHDPQSHYQNCRSFVMLIAGFLVIFFRHPSLFSLSNVECQWVFYIISSCYSLGIAFFAIEAMNAYELCTLEQLNSWTTLFPERPRSYALLAFRTGFPVVAMAIAILVILAPNYEQAISSWSCMGPFTQGTIDLWSPMVLIQMCFALIASSFSYRGLFIRKNLPHNLKKVEAYLENVSARRRNEVEKCERDLTFTAIGPWLLLLYWLTLTMSNDFVGVPYTSFLAVAFAVLYGMCNFLQSVITTPAEYSNFMWHVMRFFPSLYAPKFDPVTMFSRDEVLEVFRQRKIDAEKGNESKWKGLLVWNSTYPDYLPTYARSKMLTEWNHSYMDARNSGKTKVKACYAVYKQHVLEMELNSFHAKQTRELFLEWNVHIRRIDPLPEPVEHILTEEKKLEQDFIAVLRNVFLPIGQEEGNTVNRASLENTELRFPLCSVSSIDNQGNVTQVNVLKAPLDVKGKEEHLLSMSDDSNNEFIGGGGSDRNCEWAMTRHEKIKAAAQAQADVVWDMAVQNCDIIQYSKALTC